AMMSAVSGIRADSTTSTVTRHPASCGAIPMTDSGVRVVSCCNCCNAATTAFLAGSFGFVGCCCFVDVRSGDDARFDDAERCEVPVPSVFFRCGRFCVVCCCLLAELGCRLREAEVCAASLVCWSLIVCCLFSVRVIDMAATGTSSCPTS